MTKLSFDVMPLSTNKMYCGKKILTKEARSNKSALGWIANPQFRRPLYDKPIAVRVDFYYRDRRANDIDNLKLLFDALTGVVWIDDRIIDEQHVYRHFGAAVPRVDLEITEL